jgi:type IV pilus assembly protein PilN
MGEFDLNLSTRPFVANQFKTLLLALALIFVIAISVIQGYGFRQYSRLADQIRGAARNAQVESEALNRRLNEMDSKLSAPQAKEKLTQIEFLNDIIARKTFSWSRVFAVLEELMPEGVHLTGIRPDFAAGGPILIHMEVEAHAVSDVTALLKNLQSSPLFEDVSVTTEEKKNGAAPAAMSGTDLGVIFNVKYHPEREQ